MTGANPNPATEEIADTSHTSSSAPDDRVSVDSNGAPSISPGLATTAPSHSSGQVIKALAQNESSEVKSVEMLSKPHKTTSVSFSYRTGDSRGRKLKPGEQMLLEIPPQFRDRPIRFAVLKHRQDRDETTAPEGDSKWDANPGVTSLQVHAPSFDSDNSWRYWKAPWGSSGQAGGKYAEHRSASDPEVENMFDWIRHGHSAVGASGVSKEPLFADAIKVVSVGKDPVRVHQVDMMFLPERPDSTDEQIFSSGTVFGDPWSAEGRAYGGGPRFQGKYPGALALGGRKNNDSEVLNKVQSKPGWALENGQLEIELSNTKQFTGVEVACGDTHPDGKRNKDGHVGTLGWSKLSMGIRRAGSTKVDWFIDRQGVPPEGVLFGGPTMENFTAKPGDKLIVRADSDTTYVMGLRLWYKD
ncbi:MAG: hypothetical protein VYC39_18065 [Myxococcota bacterium]|nr:hypothetical protein [Myxococcota bacterium]